MIRARSFAVALSLAFGALSTTALVLPAGVQAAEPAQKVSAKVGKPLKAAQEAMAKKQWDVALEKIAEADAIEKKTPYEVYQIDEFRGYILIQQKKYGEAAQVYERVLNSGQLPPDQADERTKTVAQIYFQQKEYKKAADWSKRALEKHPGQEDLSVLLAQSYYLLNDYKNAGTTMSGVIANSEKNGATPKEDWIKIVLSAHYKMQNNDGVADALKKMVRYYPKTEYWENLLDIYSRKEHSDRITLGFYRLMLDTGVLKKAGDYMEMTQLAIEAGVPGEAVQVMQKGIEAGILKSADKTEQGRYDRLLAAAQKSATADKASLAQQAKEAEKAAQGQADVGVGQAFLSYGQYDEAIDALQRGIKKGGLKDVDEAQVSLGIAQLRKGQKDMARQTFKAIKDESKWNDLSELWAIRAQ